MIRASHSLSSVAFISELANTWLTFQSNWEIYQNGPHSASTEHSKTFVIDFKYSKFRLCCLNTFKMKNVALKLSIYFPFGSFTTGTVHGLSEANIPSPTTAHSEF